MALQQNTRHSLMVGADQHSVIRWEHADAADRLDDVPTAEDVGKISHQLDTDTFWVLADLAPTWVQLG